MSKFKNDDWACYCCDMCKQTERERIIKLLEAECCEMKNYQQSMGIHWALALIKGENK